MINSIKDYRGGTGDGKLGDLLLEIWAEREKELQVGMEDAKRKGLQGFWFVRGVWLDSFDYLLGPNHGIEYNTAGTHAIEHSQDEERSQAGHSMAMG